MVCASVAASDVYHDANVYLQDYYRKLPMTNAFMPSSSYGGRDIINDEQDILTTVTSDIIQCITLLLHDSRIKHHRFDAHRRKTRLRSTKNLNRFGMTPTPSTVRNSPSSRIREGIYSTFVLAIFPNMVYFFSHHDCREGVSPIFSDTNLHIATDNLPKEERDTNRMKEAESKRRKLIETDNIR